MCVWNAGPIQLLVRNTSCKRCAPIDPHALRKLRRLATKPGKLARQDWEALELAYGWLGARIERAKSRIARWLPSGGVGIEVNHDIGESSGELALILDVEGRRGNVFMSREFWLALGEHAGWMDGEDAV